MLAQDPLRVDWVSHYLFESPWMIIAGLAIVWTVLRIVGRRNQSKVISRASWLPLVCIAALLITSSMVTTRQEKLVDALDALLLSIEDKDMDTFRDIVPQDAKAYFPPGRKAETFTRDSVERRLKDANIRDLLLLGTEAGMIGERDAVTIIELRAQGDYAGIIGLQKYTWSITWRYVGERWEAYEFECLAIGFEFGNNSGNSDGDED